MEMEGMIVQRLKGKRKKERRSTHAPLTFLFHSFSFNHVLRYNYLFLLIIFSN